MTIDKKFEEISGDPKWHYSYKDENGKICMIRCLKCDRENYAIAVSSGKCAWCGYDPNKKSKPRGR